MSAKRFIVVGVDGSAGGRRALSWALEHAVQTDSTVQVVTAFGGDDPTLAAYVGSERHKVESIQEAEIEAACAGRGMIPVIAREIVAGDPVVALTDAASAADLLVVGAHGHGHLRTALLGSASAGCIRHASCPVVVVPVPKPPRQREVAETAERV